MFERERWYEQFAMGRHNDKQAIIDQRFESYVIHHLQVILSADILSSASSPSSSRWDTRLAMWHMFVLNASVNNPPFLPIEVSTP